MPRDLLADRKPRDLLAGIAPAVDPEIAKAADAYEKVRGNGAFAAATDAGASGIPFSDELYSALSALPNAAISAAEGKGFHPVDEYNRSQALQAEIARREQERHPVASTAGAIAGGIGASAPLAAGGLSFLNGAKPTLASLVGRGAAEGAAYGGVYGAGEGNGLRDRAINAVKSAMAGGATGVALGAAGRIGAAKINPTDTPTIDSLRAAKNAAYDATDHLGIRYSPESYRNLVADIVQDVQAKKINPARHPKAISILQDMIGEARSGLAPTLRQLDEQRQIIYRDIGRDEAEKFFGDRILGKIDDFIDNAKVGDALTGDPAAAPEAMNNARELNRRYRNAQRVDDAMVKAERRAASSNSGGNLENTKRQNLRRILDNKSTSRFLNDAEKEAMETAVRGTKAQNVARSMGNWLKGFGGHSLAGGSIVASAMTGNPLPLAGVGIPYLLGSGLKAASRGMGNANDAIVEALIRSGSKPAPSLGPVRRAILEALARGGGQQLPAYIGQ